MAYDNRPAAAAIAAARSTFALEAIALPADRLNVEGMARRFACRGLGEAKEFADAFGSLMIEAKADLANSPDIVRGALRLRLQSAKAWHGEALALAWRSDQPKPPEPFRLSGGQKAALASSLIMCLIVLGCFIAIGVAIAAA
jgi:hypothetical protein